MTTLKLSRVTNEFETKSFFFQSLDGSDQCVATSVVSLEKYYDFLGTNIPGDEVEKNPFAWACCTFVFHSVCCN